MNTVDPVGIAIVIALVSAAISATCAFLLCRWSFRLGAVGAGAAVYFKDKYGCVQFKWVNMGDK